MTLIDPVTGAGAAVAKGVRAPLRPAAARGRGARLAPTASLLAGLARRQALTAAATLPIRSYG